MIRYMYIWQNNYHNKFSYIISHIYSFLLMKTTFKINSFSNYQIYNTVLLTITIILYLTSSNFKLELCTF